MADEPLHLGIVGANPNVGWASRTHLPALLNLPEYDLTAVCTTKRESAEASAQKYEAHKAYWSYRDLVADPEIDVVDVCVKVPYHHEIVMAALEAGKHVYCEWPLTRTAAEAAGLAAEAEQAGVHTAVGLQARFAPAVERARRLVAEGAIGLAHPISVRLAADARRRRHVACRQGERRPHAFDLGRPYAGCFLLVRRPVRGSVGGRGHAGARMAAGGRGNGQSHGPRLRNGQWSPRRRRQRHGDGRQRPLAQLRRAHGGLR